MLAAGATISYTNVDVAGDGGGDPTARAVGAGTRGLVLRRAPPYFVRARF